MINSTNGNLPSTSLNFTVDYRLAEKADLTKLEWMGQYTHFRRVFQDTYREQQAGRRLMLLAVTNYYPIGQIFVSLGSGGREYGYLYALRVLQPFQGHGLGTQLIHYAEAMMLQHSLRYATIAVAKENIGARRLYERLGYQIYNEDSGRWSYHNHEGRLIHVHEPCWMLEKTLEPTLENQWAEH